MASDVKKTSFNDPAQLRALCDSQQKQLIAYSVKLQKLEESEKALKEELAQYAAYQAKQDIFTNSSKIINLEDKDSEVICKVQLALLKEKSLHGELSFEDTKKVDIFSGILHKIEAAKKEKSDKEKLKDISSIDLMKLLDVSQVKEQNGQDPTDF